VDAVDLRMLRELQADPSRPRMALAERVNLSPKYR
jgi:DNA-binding Lrp family transcriptional regulator